MWTFRVIIRFIFSIYIYVLHFGDVVLCIYLYICILLNDNSLWEIFSHARDAKPIFGTVLSIPGCHRLLAACYHPCWSLRVSFKMRSRKPEDFRWTVFGASIDPITSYILPRMTFHNDCSNDYSSIYTRRIEKSSSFLKRIISESDLNSLMLFKYPSKCYQTLPASFLDHV